MTQLQMSMTWMFCSSRMSPERVRSQSQLRRRVSSGGHARLSVVHGCRRVVVGGDAGEFAERAGMDAVDDLDEGRRAADLEADIDADLALCTLGYLESFDGLRNIDADRLLAVCVLPAGNDGFEMLNVEERRRGDLDGVDVFGAGELFEGAVAVEGETGVDGGHIQRGVELVEMLFAEGELVREDVRERDQARGGVLREGGSNGGAAVAATEQPEAHGGVGLIAEGG